MIASHHSAAQTFWSQTSGPVGGSMSSVCVDSTERLMIGTEAGGVFESPDNGETWYPRNAGLISFHMRQLEASPLGYVFAVTYDNGMYRYFHDDQPHWVPLDTTFSFGSINTVAVAPNGHLFIGTSRHRILRSLDNGTTWDAPDTGIASKDIEIDQLTAAPDGHLLALAVNISTYHLYTSTDDGAHWQQIPLSAQGGTPKALLALPLNANDAYGTIFYGDKKGQVFRSADNGASWSIVYSDSAGHGINDNSIVRNPLNAHLFFRNDYGDLLRSVDNGSTWKRIAGDTLGGSQYPSAIDGNGVFYSGTDYEGMLRSEDDGASFVTVNGQLISNLMYQVAVDPNGTVYAMTEDLIFRTADSGKTWKRLPFSVGEELAPPGLAIDSAGVIYVGTINGVFVSRDSGNTWENPIAPPLHQASNQCFQLAISPGGAVYAATQYGLEVSVDRGRTWKPVAGPLGTAEATGVIAGPNSDLYASDVSGVLYHSVESGPDWTPLLSANGTGLVAATAHGSLYSISNRMLAISIDTAQNWTQIWVPDSLHSRAIFSILFDHQNNLLASTDSGVYRSRDMGMSWEDVSSGLHDASATRISYITSLAQDPKSGIFYAASRGQGIFRSVPNLVSAVRNSTNVESISGCALEQNYPNPFSLSTTIPFSLRESSNVRVEVRDVLGNLIWSRNMHRMESGNYSVVFSDKDLPCGAYLCVLQTDSGSVSSWITVVK
ncbi:MAG TPA: hypothetical protein VG537_02690 [Candidatus Kapabacteria bacterium]|nr:hypothetical protein [Candidatus Kapabacteria bacterium]